MDKDKPILDNNTSETFYEQYPLYIVYEQKDLWVLGSLTNLNGTVHLMQEYRLSPWECFNILDYLLYFASHHILLDNQI